MRRPFGFPDEIDFDFADVGYAGEAVIDLLEDEATGGALLRGEGHGDLDPLARPGGRGVGVRAGLDFVDEAEVDEVELDLGVVAIAQGGEDVGFGENSV